MIGIFSASIAGSSVAGLASAVVVQSLFFTAVSVLMVIAAAILRPPTVSKGSPSDETGGTLRRSRYSDHCRRGDRGPLDSIMTIWNVVLGVAVMLWAFGFTQMKALLSNSRSGQAAEKPKGSNQTGQSWSSLVRPMMK